MSSMANVVSVVKPVIWLGRVRPAGEGVLEIVLVIGQVQAVKRPHS